MPRTAYDQQRSHCQQIVPIQIRDLKLLVKTMLDHLCVGQKGRNE